MNGLEPVYNLIIKILSIKKFNTILCLIDLKANASTDNSTTENTSNCIDSIAENSPINQIVVSLQPNDHGRDWGFIS